MNSKSKTVQRRQLLRRVILVGLFLVGVAVALFQLFKPDDGLDVAVDTGFQGELVEAIDTVKPGERVDVRAGLFYLSETLRLTTEDIRLSGEGPDKTILSFRPLPSGLPSILVDADNIAVENMTILDATGAAVFVNEARNVTIRNMQVEWTEPENANNGPYGLTAVRGSNLLIENNALRGAAGAGVFLLDMDNAMVRDNRISAGTVGVAIASSRNVTLENNTLSQNSTGVTVVDMPERARATAGGNVRLQNNKIFRNNRPLADVTNEMQELAFAGVGIAIYGADSVEVRQNEMQRHDGANIAVLARPAESFAAAQGFDRYPETIYIVSNRLTDAGGVPTGLLARLPDLGLSPPFPDILYDGAVNPEAVDGSGALKASRRVCLANNSAARVANLDRSNVFDGQLRDAGALRCDLPPLEPTVLPINMK